MIEKGDGWPIVIEAEVGNHHQAELEAISRLNRRVASTGREVHASVALVYPQAIRNHQGQALRSALGHAQFEYALYAAAQGGSESRFPETGWISGDIADLSLLLHRSSMPAWRVDELADSLERGVVRASGRFTASHAHGSALGKEIAEILGQSDDCEGQTRRMAMTVVVDALVFHAALSKAEMGVRTTPERTVHGPTQFREHGTFLPSQILDEWDLILQVNYWPIFHTSRAIVRALPTELAADLLKLLWETAERLIAGGVTTSHDLTGAVFQRLIADRKFLATFYTRPAAAALLAALALPQRQPLKGADWGDAEGVSELRVGGLRVRHGHASLDGISAPGASP